MNSGGQNIWNVVQNKRRIQELLTDSKSSHELRYEKHFSDPIRQVRRLKGGVRPLGSRVVFQFFFLSFFWGVDFLVFPMVVFFHDLMFRECLVGDENGNGREEYEAVDHGGGKEVQCYCVM